MSLHRRFCFAVMLPLTCQRARVAQVIALVGCAWLMVMVDGGVNSVAAQTRREVLPQPMFSDPLPEDQVDVREHEALMIPLWNRSLQDANLAARIQAADNIAIAHRFGMPGLEGTVAALIDCFRGEDSRVSRAAARTLCLIDAQEAREAFEAALPTAAPEVSFWIESALVRWKSEVALAWWRQRIGDSTLRTLDRRTALEHLAAWGDSESAGAVRSLVLDPTLPLVLRMTAAETLAQLASAGEEATATQLLETPAPTGELLSARLLAEHRSSEAQQLLLKLVAGTSDAAAGLAAQQLFDQDPQLLYPQAIALCSRQDRDLRLVAVATLLHRAEPTDVDQLLEMFDDFHPDVRHQARLACETLMQNQAYTQKISDYVSQALADRRGPEHWRSLEQCCVFTAHLDQENNSQSLLELLDEQRDEVNCAAAWALREIALESTFEPIHQYCIRTFDAQDNRELKPPFPAEKMAHLCQLFGQVRYSTADATLRRLIPKESGFPFETRAAAIWSLGLLHEGTVEPDLAQKLTARMMDATGLPAEFTLVREMSACALGRMKAEAQVPQLEQIVAANGLATHLGWLAAWSLDQIDGRGIDPVPPWVERETNWFVYPILK